MLQDNLTETWGDIKVPIKEIPSDLLEEYRKHHKEKITTQ